MEEYRIWWFLDEQKETVIVNGLTPNRTHYIAVAGVRADDKQRRFLEPVAVKLPGVLEVRKVGDVFGVNAFPYIETGAAHQKRSPEEERENVPAADKTGPGGWDEVQPLVAQLS